MLQSIYLSEEIIHKVNHAHSLHLLIGDDKNIKKFFDDLKKEKYVTKCELNKNCLFLCESVPKSPVRFFNTGMFFIKPLIIDTNGYEYWELASWEKEKLMKFIQNIKKNISEFKLGYIKNVPLSNLYFPKIFPNLTDLQKRALELAISEGYYDIPKKISLRKLAQIMSVALATFQQHLQTAEHKIMPDAFSLVK